MLLWFFTLFLLLLPPPSGCTKQLHCYACGGHALLKCTEFNASAPGEEFVQRCVQGQRACRKGWVNSALPGEDAEVRSCTILPEDICLSQNGGGSCSCVKNMCNAASKKNIMNVFCIAWAVLMTRMK